MKKINEKQLKAIVAESVKRTLNELSTDLLYRASNAAEAQGRYNQAKSFATTANERMRNEFGGNTIRYVSNKTIEIQLDAYTVITLLADGKYEYQSPNESYSGDLNLNNNYLFRTGDKATARKIAKWCSRYMAFSNDADRQKACDWHTWCIL